MLLLRGAARANPPSHHARHPCDQSAPPQSTLCITLIERQGDAAAAPYCAPAAPLAGVRAFHITGMRPGRYTVHARLVGPSRKIGSPVFHDFLVVTGPATSSVTSLSATVAGIRPLPPASSVAIGARPVLV